MTTVLNVRIDATLKRDAQKAAAALGLPISTVVAASLRDFVRTRSITISDEPRLKPEIEAELLRISADARNGINVSPAFSNPDDAIAWLHSNDE